MTFVFHKERKRERRMTKRAGWGWRGDTVTEGEVGQRE